MASSSAKAHTRYHHSAFLNRSPNTNLASADDTVLYPVHGTETVFFPTRPTRQQLPPHSRVRRWWSRCLTQDAPEFGAALGFIDDFLEESHVVSTHTELMDPTIGSLMAFGRARDTEKSTRFHNIVAFAAGPIGADLSVGVVKEKPMGVSGVAGLALDVPRISDGAESVWRGDSAIRQIVFASDVGQKARCELLGKEGWGGFFFAYVFFLLFFLQW